jgi:cytidylate kinase
MGFSGVIALDGPSGTGKSTVARGLASRLGARYLDTGAMYRAATVAVLRSGADLADSAAMARVLAAHSIEVSTDPDRTWTTLDGEDVTHEIRSAETTAAVSPVSAVAAVRAVLVASQRAIIAEGAIVAEGRDVGSVVWPDAELKIYLTATEAVRAARRAGEIADADPRAIAESLRRRDAFDSSRTLSPLRRADGATELDTSELSVQQVIDLLASMALRPVGAAHHG